MPEKGRGDFLQELESQAQVEREERELVNRMRQEGVSQRWKSNARRLKASVLGCWKSICGMCVDEHTKEVGLTCKWTDTDSDTVC